jgi:hypothetical protein
MTRRMRSAGTSCGQYHSLPFAFRSQRRGTSTSRMTTDSIRPPEREIRGAAVPLDVDGLTADLFRPPVWRMEVAVRRALSALSG